MNNQLDVAVLVALLAGAGFYLCTSRRLLRVLFGMLMLSNAANLVLLSASGDPTDKRAPVITGEAGPLGRVDPLPQALILTAIVIGFAVMSFFAVFIYRIYADRHYASVTALFAAAPPADSPAAREVAADVERRGIEDEAARKLAASKPGHGGHGHDTHGSESGKKGGHA